MVVVALATGVWDRSEVKTGSIVIHCHKIQLTLHCAYKLIEIIFLDCPDPEDRGNNFRRNIAGCRLSSTYCVPEDLDTFGGPIPDAGVSDKPLSLVDIRRVMGTVYLYVQILICCLVPIACRKL